jgi:hypothetical protein
VASWAQAGSAAARVLSFWIRLSPGALTFVSYECCMSSGIVPDLGLVIHIEETYRVFCANCVRLRIRAREGYNPNSDIMATKKPLGRSLSPSFSSQSSRTPPAIPRAWINASRKTLSPRKALSRFSQWFFRRLERSYPSMTLQYGNGTLIDNIETEFNEESVPVYNK